MEWKENLKEWNTRSRDEERKGSGKKVKEEGGKGRKKSHSFIPPSHLDHWSFSSFFFHFFSVLSFFFISSLSLSPHHHQVFFLAHSVLGYVCQFLHIWFPTLIHLIPWYVNTISKWMDKDMKEVSEMRKRERERLWMRGEKENRDQELKGRTT